MLTAKWLKQILTGEKKLLKAKDARHCNPPRYDEISVASLYQESIKMPNMAEYFPDAYPKGRSCNREYFFTVMATLHPKYTDELVKKSKKDRFGKEVEVEQGEAIAITPDWEAQLKEFPQFTSKSPISLPPNSLLPMQDPAAACWHCSRRRARWAWPSRSARDSKR